MSQSGYVRAARTRSTCPPWPRLCRKPNSSSMTSLLRIRNPHIRQVGLSRVVRVVNILFHITAGTIKRKMFCAVRRLSFLWFSHVKYQSSDLV